MTGAVSAAPPEEILDAGTSGQALRLYEQMLLIRRFEDTVQSLFQKGHVHGTTHLCSGQEAVPVGVASVLGERDRVAGTYRGHGHALALGVDPQGLLDELLGRASGVCGGRAGSMNIIDLKNRLIGCFGIIGGSIAAATGASLALQGTGDIAVAFFGDGTTNQAYIHECLNFAQVFKLPVVYVCENNLYGEFTPWEQVTAGTICGRVASYGVPTQTIDGNDVWAVQAATRTAAARARRGEGPAFIEALTYRFVGHSRSDPGKYRKPGELEQWRKRDPLLLARATLIELFGVDAEEVDRIAATVDQQLQVIVDQALAAPFPTPGPAAEFKG